MHPYPDLPLDIRLYVAYTTWQGLGGIQGWVSEMAVAAETEKNRYNCVAGRIRMLNRIVTGIYDEALAPLGLKISQLSVLAALNRRGRAGAGELCATLKMDKSTVSRNVERMARRRWLSVKRDRGSRTQLVVLTAKGTKLLHDAYPLWLRAQEEAARRLGEEGLAALSTLTEKLGDSK